MKPEISVIVNCYNGERYLKEAIDSILVQSYKDLELIFWDNQSSDASASIIKSYSDPRIRYILAPRHTILGEARKLALEEARGNWVAFLDTDDTWDPSKLERQIDIIKNSNEDLGFVYGRAEIYFEDNPGRSFIFKKGRTLPEGRIFDSLCRDDYIPFLSGLVNRKKLMDSGGLSERYKHSIDYFMYLNLAHRYPVRAVQDVCCRYRVHSSNLTHVQKFDGIFEAIEIVSAFLPANSAKVGIRYHYANLVMAKIRAGSLGGAFWTMLKSRCSWIVVRKIIYGFYDRIIRRF
ncbi:MAG: glycosyltransferase [Leptospiraceae bacterium]